MVDGAAGVGEGATVDVVVGAAGVSVGEAVAVALAATDVGDGVLVSESELEQAAKTPTVKGKRAAAANFASQLGRIRDSCMLETSVCATVQRWGPERVKRAFPEPLAVASAIRAASRCRRPQG